jgi:hypothetical protein
MSSFNNIYYIMGAPAWDPGFFCCFQALVGFLNYCEQTNPIGYKVFFERGLYLAKEGDNWWEYFFEPISGGEPENNIKERHDIIIEHMSDVQKSAWNTEAISTMSRERAGELIDKYIKLKPFMQEAVNNFIENSFKEYTIGVHFRSLDKSSEAPLVPFVKVKQEVLRIAATQSNYKVFVATDELAFLTYMQNHFGDRVVAIDAIRSSNSEPIHHNHGKPMPNPYKLGEDAVLDCYLLSKTNILVRTQSNLSSSAANINPNLTVIDLNKAHYRAGLR